MEPWIREIEAEVRRLGQRMLSADRSNTKVDVKGAADFVTNHDRANQADLARRLPEILPGAVFVGEEEEIHASIEKGFAFIVDPIDGTTNFIKDYHMSAISVGVTKDGAPFAGIVYNPYLDEMYTAQTGCGAYLNGAPISVSSRSLDNGIVVFGTTLYYREYADETFRMAREYFDCALDIRRSGSAALDLCAVAAGRCELFFELVLSPWDFAAGAVIVQEAGGRCLTLDKTPVTPGGKCSVLAASPAILDALPDPRHPKRR